MNPQPAILVITGASGAGKTTLIHALDALRLPGVGCYFFDSIGVPSPEEMVRRFGSGDGWQSAMTEEWITRLLRKKAVHAERDGRRYLYTPLLAREQYVQQESKGLLDRLFGGRVAPLVAHFSEQRKLTKKDIAELRKLLKELDDEQH